MKLVQAVEIITTLDDADRATEMGREAVEARLAACAQISGPIKSVYVWKDGLEQTHEWLLTFKAPLALQSQLAEFVRDRHPYELPEILCREVSVSGDYFTWMEEVTGRR
jgi:periplasmic divalent cation tolerance protein